MKGRPPSRNKGLRDGFYLEVLNKGANTGIKIRKESEAEMMEAVEEYRRENKTVTVLGQHKKGEWVNQKGHTKSSAAKAERKAAREAKAVNAAPPKQEVVKTPAQQVAKPAVVKKPAAKKPAAKKVAKPAVAAKKAVKKVASGKTAKPAKKAGKKRH